MGSWKYPQVKDRVYGTRFCETRGEIRQCFGAGTPDIHSTTLDQRAESFLAKRHYLRRGVNPGDDSIDQDSRHPLSRLCPAIAAYLTIIAICRLLSNAAAADHSNDL